MTQTEINKYLDNLPVDSRRSVKTEQIEAVKTYMRSRKWDGGLHFTADWKTIYKTSVPDEMPAVKIIEK